MNTSSIQDLKQSFQNGITLEGANLQSTHAFFGTFFEFFKDYAETAQQKESLLWFEKYFDFLLAESQRTSVKPMKVIDDHVVIEDGMIFHRCKPTLETLNNISKCLLATEWFGILDSECECRFCASLDTVRITQRKGFTKFYTGTQQNCVLYFDTSNPIMQKLLQTDFYRYAELKRNAPEKIEEQYTPEMIKFMEYWILPNSNGGKYHSDEYKKLVCYDWWAIPGGVPSQLVNGVGISNNNPELASHIKEISTMFPNAVIFDENKQVLYTPSKERTKASN